MNAQSDEERAWNEAHGLTATCYMCGKAMKDDGRDVCSWLCWSKTRQAKP